jgi:hypothetical protein
MPATLKPDRAAASLALKAKRGQTSPRRLGGMARRMYETMSVRELSRYTKER